MRVLVCGGRDYWNQARINEVLDAQHLLTPFSLLIQGGARGADSCAHNWAISRGIWDVEERAQWAAYGPHAGNIRNRVMIEKYSPELVIAFPGNFGTANMIWQALRARIQVLKFDDSGPIKKFP